MKIAFFDIQPIEEKFLKAKIPSSIECFYFKETLDIRRHLDENVKNVEIISVFTSSILTSGVLEKFPNLKFILTRSVGYSHIDINWCKKHNVFVFNTPHYGDFTVSEYVFGILLNTVRKIEAGANDVKKGIIKQEKYMGFELFNKTLGVIGVGAIGKRVLEIAKGFKMKTLAYDPNMCDIENYTTLDDIFKNSDIISINAPLVDETFHLIDEKAILKMKEGVIIVNCARGEIINTEALYNGLLNKKIAFAALDVIECEEILCTENQVCKGLDALKESCLAKFYLNQKLAQMPNVTITPHMAYNTKEAVERILEMTLENLNSCLDFTTSAKNLVLL